MDKFYVDACIYINHWQSEIETGTGRPLWELAQAFFGKYLDATFYFSGFLLRELEFNLTKKEFEQHKEVFRQKNFRKLIMSSGEWEEARRMEWALKFSVSFYDLIHLLLARKAEAILVTRDRRLIGAARQYSVDARRPEDL